MSKIQIIGDAAILTTKVLTKDIETLQKYKPQALKLVDEATTEEKFAIKTGSNASLSKYGAVFTGSNAEGKATCTLNLPTGLSAEQKAEYVKDNYGYSLLTLNELETEIVAVMDETSNEFVEMSNSIEVL